MRTPRVLISLYLLAASHAFALPTAVPLKLPDGAKPVAIEVGAQGDLYLAGSIWSSSPNSAIVDSFVARYDPRVGQLVYLHQFGAAISFTQNSLAVDANGAAYVTGDAPSTFLPSFPTFGANTPANTAPIPWIAKLDAAGQFIYASLIPGASSGHAAAIAVNAIGEVYLTGTAQGVVATPGAAVNRDNSSFVMKLDVTGSHVLFTERGIGGVAIVLDAQQNVYVAGAFTPSLSNPFSLVDPSLPPVTPNVFQHNVPIGQCSASTAFVFSCPDQHVAKLDPSGSNLIYGVYLTGTNGATPSSLAVDAKGDLFITGYTPSSNYPVTAGAVDEVYRDAPGAVSPSAVAPRLTFYIAPPQIGFVTELNPDASDLVFSTYLGGAPPPGYTTPFNTNVIRDPATKVRLFNDQVYVTGLAGSTDFPGLAALSPRCLPAISYLLRLSKDGKSVGYAQSFPLIDAKQIVTNAGSNGLISSIAFDAQGVAYQVGPGALVYRVDPSIPDSPGCTVDSATYQSTDTTAPGQLLSIFGAWPVASSVAANVTAGLLPTALGNVTVDFDGMPGRLLYASPDQINVMVPYEIAGRTSTTMNVRTQDGAFQSARTLNVVPRRTSAFTYDLIPGGCQPSFPGDDLPLARNADGTFNSCSNPARGGSIVTFYLNGGGLPAAGATTGSISVAATPIGIPVTVSGQLGSSAAEVVNLSLEPGSVSGVWRLDVRVPAANQDLASLALGIYVDGVLLNNRVLEVEITR